MQKDILREGLSRDRRTQCILQTGSGMKPSIFSPTQVKSSVSTRKVPGTPREIFAPASKPALPPTAHSECHELCTISLDPRRAAGKISSRRNRELQFHGHFSGEPDVAICNGNGTDRARPRLVRQRRVGLGMLPYVTSTINLHLDRTPHVVTHSYIQILGSFNPFLFVEVVFDNPIAWAAAVSQTKVHTRTRTTARARSLKLVTIFAHF